MSNSINTERLMGAIVEEFGFLLETNTITNDNAIDLLTITTDRVYKKWGGISVYIPKNRELWRKKRDDKIRADSILGMNASELCIKYRLSVQRIYKILKNK